MAGSLNLIVLFGRLGKDPEMRFSQGGKEITTFSLATDRREQDSSGEWKTTTDWFNIKCFGKTAENANNYLAKGKRALIVGKHTTRAYQKDGETKYFQEVLANQVIFIDKSDEQQSLTPEDEDIEGAIPF